MLLRDRIIFISVVTIIFIFLQFIVFKTFRNYLKEKNLVSKKWKRLSLYPFIIFSVPFIFIFTAKYITLPNIIYDIYILPFFVFQGSVFFIAIYLMICKLLKLPFIASRFLLRKIKYFKEKYNHLVKKKPVKRFDESRRAFIRASTVFVSGFAFTGAGIGVIGKDDFKIKHNEIKILNLPEELKGLKLIQVNDIHSGPFMSKEQMRIYCRVISDLKPDIVLIPGDITNTIASEVYPFTEAFRDLNSRYGVFVTLGNHDYFSDPDFIADKIKKETPFIMLRNDSRLLKINGKELLIMGTEDTRNSGSKFDKNILNYLDDTISGAQKSASDLKLDYEMIPKIYLCHKPYLFPQMTEKNLDLLLCGHTHGGQIALIKTKDLNISFASSVSPYISGLYRENNSQMYISDGIGTVGLPIRINCPPEITVITLV